MPDENGWNEHRREVMGLLELQGKSIESLRTGQESIRVAIAGLQVKSGIWGMIGACIPVGLGILIWWVKA